MAKSENRGSSFATLADAKEWVKSSDKDNIGKDESVQVAELQSFQRNVKGVQKEKERIKNGTRKTMESDVAKKGSVMGEDKETTMGKENQNKNEKRRRESTSDKARKERIDVEQEVEKHEEAMESEFAEGLE